MRRGGEGKEEESEDIGREGRESKRDVRRRGKSGVQGEEWRGKKRDEDIMARHQSSGEGKEEKKGEVTELKTWTCTLMLKLRTCTLMLKLRTCTLMLILRTCTLMLKLRTCTLMLKLRTCTLMLKLRTCTLMQSYSHTSYQSQSQSFFTRLPNLPVMGVTVCARSRPAL